MLLPFLCLLGWQPVADGGFSSFPSLSSYSSENSPSSGAVVIDLFDDDLDWDDPFDDYGSIVLMLTAPLIDQGSEEQGDENIAAKLMKREWTPLSAGFAAVVLLTFLLCLCRCRCGRRKRQKASATAAPPLLSKSLGSATVSDVDSSSALDRATPTYTTSGSLAKQTGGRGWLLPRETSAGTPQLGDGAPDLTGQV